MDEHIEDTRILLDDRFGRADEEGVYFANQPVYGFRAGHAERKALRKYTITLHMTRVLSHLAFESLVDVGGAEGREAALAREIFGVEVASRDLSPEACRRASGVFGVEGVPADVLLKDERCYAERPRTRIPPRRIIGFSVPLHCLAGGQERSGAPLVRACDAGIGARAS